VTTLIGAIAGGAIGLAIAVVIVSWIGQGMSDATDVLVLIYVTPVLVIVGSVAGAVILRGLDRRSR